MICTVRTVRNAVPVQQLRKKNGLEPLANLLSLQQLDHSAEEEAEAYISEEKGVASAEEALQGAMDIVAEAIADEADYRTYIREKTMKRKYTDFHCKR
mgnify:CR=1 FL=1